MKMLEKLQHQLTLGDVGLVGCRRRGKWSQDGVPTWRWLRGNSLLYIMGDKKEMETPVGIVEFYMQDDFELLQFRGGPWNLDWMEDFYDLWSLVWKYWDLDENGISPNIIVVHENKGDMDIKEVKVPDALDPEHRVEKMLAEWVADPPGRISKSGSRAARICPHCPHKQRCDAEDRLQGQTDDWSPTYPQP